MDERLQQLLEAQEDTLSLAELYDKKRAEGLNPQAANQYVGQFQQGRTGQTQPTQQESPAPKTGLQRLEGIGKTALRGATLGFADEIVGAMAGGMSMLRPGDQSFSEEYTHFRDKAREDLDSFQETNPLASGISDFAGGFLIPGLGTAGSAARGTGAVGRAARAVTPSRADALPKRIGKGMVEGAAFGGVAGAGYSEEGTEGAVPGGILGAALGGALPIAGSAIRGARNIAPATAGRPDRLIREAIEADRGNPDEALRRLLGQTDEGGQILEAPELSQDVPVGLLDLFGENVARLGRASVTAGDEATHALPKLLRRRVDEQTGRMMNTAQESLGVKQRSLYGTADDIIKSRSEESGPLYDLLGQVGKIDDAEIDSLLNLPALRKAYNTGRKKFKRPEEDPTPPLTSGAQAALTDTPDAASPGFLQHLYRIWANHNKEAADKIGNAPENLQEFFQHAGWITPNGSLAPDVPFEALRNRVRASRDTQIEANRIARLPTARGLHYTKRALDSMIGRSKRSGDNELSSILMEHKKRLLSRMDDVLEHGGEKFYKKARGIYAGKSAMLDAMQDGRSIFRMHPEEIQRYVAELTEGEAEMFRLGAIDVISEIMMKTADNRNLYDKIFNSQWKRQQLRALFGDNEEGFEQFAKMMEIENTMARNKNFVTGGSNTANKQVDIAEIAGVPLEAMSTATGGLGSILSMLGKSALNARREGVTRKIADDLGGKLALGMDNDRDALVEYLQQLGQSTDRHETTSDITTAIRKALMAQLGESAGTDY